MIDEVFVSGMYRGGYRLIDNKWYRKTEKSIFAYDEPAREFVENVSKAIEGLEYPTINSDDEGYITVCGFRGATVAELVEVEKAVKAAAERAEKTRQRSIEQFMKEYPELEVKVKE